LELPDMTLIVLTLGLVLVAAVSAACSTTPAPPVPSGPVDPNGPTIVAKGKAFSPTTAEVKAGVNFTLHFDNQDGFPHNVAIYTDSSASSPISVGEIISSSKADQVVPALKPGTYFFRCNVHMFMTGRMVAK
jgi:plastocyanin